MAVEGRLEEQEKYALVRLEERIQSLIETVREIKTAQVTTAKDMIGALEKHASEDDIRFAADGIRIKSLEDWRTYIIGGMAIGAALLGFLMWAVSTFWTNAPNVSVQRSVTETQTITPTQQQREKKPVE